MTLLAEPGRMAGIAQAGAVLDVVSHGRVDFGVGRGHPFPGVYDNFRIAPLGSLAYDVMRREHAIFGEPSYCLERLPQLREALGVQQIIAWMNIGGMPHDKVMRSMRLFGERALPAIG